MRRLWSGVFGLFVVVAGWPTTVEAQGRSCRQVLPSDFRRIVNVRGEEVVYFRDPVQFRCTGDVILEADSAVLNRSASAVELVGSVLYRDSTRELRSEWANYIGRMDQLLARDAVVLRDLEGGAVIEGEQLNYLRESATRPESQMVITGGRPYAVIPPRPSVEAPEAADPIDPIDPDDLVDPAQAPQQAPSPGQPRDTADVPTQVWADRMELQGENVFLALGSVDLRRGDMVGAGDRALFDQAAERMTLTGSAFVQNETYRLEGDQIDAFMEGEGLREVRSEGSARVTSENLNVTAQQVRIGFAGGELERLEAWNPDPAAGPRARAEARDFRMRADSIDARADSVGIRELRAVGRAYGERALGDEAGAPAETPGRPLPDAIARDWIQGDTILGFFGRAAAPEPDAEPARVPPERAVEGIAEGGEIGGETEREIVLERIVVVGGSGPALSLYRMATDEGAERPGINFMRAQRIILFMEQGELARVEAEGPIQGVHLDPTGAGIGGGGAPGGTSGEGR